MDIHNHGEYAMSMVALHDRQYGIRQQLPLIFQLWACRVRLQRRKHMEDVLAVSSLNLIRAAA